VSGPHFTPGPWDYCACGCGFIGGGDDQVATITIGKWGDYGTDLITGECSLVHHWGTVPPERAEANARLIASAPELYEALDELRRACFGTPVGGGDGGTYAVGTPSAATMNKALAALMKARGEAA
jgi:hypothetical protein